MDSSSATRAAVSPAAAGDGEVCLIARIVAGERSLFSELIKPYRRSIFLTALSVLRDPADAEEVAQEATLKAFAHLAELRSGVTFKAWLLQIVLNEARMRWRKDRKHLYEPIADPAAEEEPSRLVEPRDQRELASETLVRKETRRAITEALGTLSEDYREVFLLRDIQHLSVEETARALRISSAAVKTRLHRARLQMRGKLKLSDQAGADLQSAAYVGKLDGMAGRVEYAVLIECPRALVWETLTDWRNWPNWERIRGLYGNVYWKEGQPWVVGSRFVFEHRIKVGPLPFTFDAAMLITGMTPLEQIAWINHGVGVTVQQTTDLAEAQDGGTMVSTSAEFLGKVFQQSPVPYNAVEILRGFIVNFYDALAEESGRRFRPR